MKKISIGLPVYNGEKYLRNRLDSILSQTFTNFELIISDNASTDSTSEICKDFEKNDSRIHYFHQSKNMGTVWNFNFVLQKATEEYFTWAAVDDLWEPSFLEKNLEVLELNSNMVGSISDVDFFGKYKIRYDDPSINITKHRHVHPIAGNYFEKAKFFLKSRQATMIYAIFRTKSLKKSIPKDRIYPNDTILLLNVLKFGDFNVLDELLMHRSSEGVSSVGMLHSLKSQNLNRIEILFMYFPFTKWSIKNLGFKFMFKNFSVFAGLLYVSYGRITLDIMRTIKYHFIKN